MKGLFKKLALCMLAFVALFTLASCNQECPKCDECEECEECEICPVCPEKETEAQIDAAKQAALAKIKEVYDSKNLASQPDKEYVAIVEQLYSYGQLFINNSLSVAAAQANATLIVTEMNKLEAQVVPANGVFSYVAATYEERAEILGILEKYAVEAGLTGITVFEDSGYVLYSPDVQKGTLDYIPGYGFGVISEGRINADLAGETNAAWKRYYHTFEADDPKNINYADDKGEVVGDLVGYIAGSYWSTRMNETKDGYEWFNELAKEKPQAQNASEVTGLATIYKFEVKTGKDGLKYSTLSTPFAKYNGQEVVADDYLTPFKVRHTQANGYERGAEQLNGSGSIKGMQAFYNATKDGFNQEAWDKVGLKVETAEDGKVYMTVEFNIPTSQFYAMYYLASSLNCPVPQGFIDEIGGPLVWGKYDSAKNYTPVDTTLSCGPYVLERWDQEQQIVFKKNTLFDSEGRYVIEGIHVNILSASKEDPEAALNEFLIHKLHSCGIPSTKLDEYKNDERASQTVGASTTKLNVNTCTPEEWEYLFGVNGTVTQTPKSDYWKVEPALSNEDFVRGLSYAINRNEFATSKGRTPSVNYFGTAYLSDPEEGIAYNNSKYHQDAVASLLDGTEMGYSLEKARQSFKLAAEKLLADGAYPEGEIDLEIAWQSQANVTVYHDAIAKYWTDAFNDPSVCGNKLTLKVTPYVPTTWSDVYYKKMMIGQFDIGFGGITGNPLNPLNFVEVLKSDNSSGFTLNWGPDTNAVTGELVFQGRSWSFDALWQASETGGYFKDGVFVKNHDTELKTDGYLNADGTVTVEFKANKINGIDGVNVDVVDAVIYGYFDVEGEAKYGEESVTFAYNEANDTITCTISAEQYAKYAQCLKDRAFGMDIYYQCEILEIATSALDSVSFSLPALPAE